MITIEFGTEEDKNLNQGQNRTKHTNSMFFYALSHSSAVKIYEISYTTLHIFILILGYNT